MYYCLICYPKIDTSKIESFREKYDPMFYHIEAHMTFVFPINTDKIDRAVLLAHIKNMTNDFPAFNISLGGFEKSWDHYLFLKIKNGIEKFIELHDKLYTGVLEQHLRKDLPFSPHLTLGHIVKDCTYNKALTEANKLNMGYKTKIDCLTLITLNDDFSKVLESEEFRLKK